jgi:hypothetical protein
MCDKINKQFNCFTIFFNKNPDVELILYLDYNTLLRRRNVHIRPMEIRSKLFGLIKMLMKLKRLKRGTPHKSPFVHSWQVTRIFLKPLPEDIDQSRHYSGRNSNRMFLKLRPDKLSLEASHSVRRRFHHLISTLRCRIGTIHHLAK